MKRDETDREIDRQNEWDREIEWLRQRERMIETERQNEWDWETERMRQRDRMNELYFMLICFWQQAMWMKSHGLFSMLCFLDNCEASNMNTWSSTFIWYWLKITHPHIQAETCRLESFAIAAVHQNISSKRGYILLLEISQYHLVCPDLIPTIMNYECMVLIEHRCGHGTPW